MGNYWPFLKYKIVQSEELQAIYQMTEGLEHRLKDQIQAGFFSRINGTYENEAFWTRLQRLATYIVKYDQRRS